MIFRAVLLTSLQAAIFCDEIIQNNNEETSSIESSDQSETRGILIYYLFTYEIHQNTALRFLIKIIIKSPLLCLLYNLIYTIFSKFPFVQSRLQKHSFPLFVSLFCLFITFIIFNLFKIRGGGVVDFSAL